MTWTTGVFADLRHPITFQEVTDCLQPDDTEALLTKRVLTKYPNRPMAGGMVKKVLYVFTVVTVHVEDEP